MIHRVCQWIGSRRTVAAACACGLMFVAVSFARADDVADIKVAAHDFAEAITRGDAVGAKGNSISSEATDGMIDTISSAVTSFKRLEKAAVARFGETGRTLANQNPGSKWDAQLTGATIKVTGDTAAITTKDKPEPLSMRKQNGRWKVDLTKQLEQLDRERLKQYFATLTQTSRIAEEAAAELDAGKYKTVKEAEDALVAKVRASFGTTGTTQPHREEPRK